MTLAHRGGLKKASDLFVKCLEHENVKYVFGVPGEETEDLLFSLEKSTITFIPTRHEQGAAFMADVWGRLSHKAGVCLSTLGPGATNLVTGVADANLDKSPLVAISGQAGIKRLYKESHQYLNLVELFRPITKWNSTIASPDSIPEVIRKAFKIAESQKPGATHIEFPEDIAAMLSRAKPMAINRVRRPDPDVQAVNDAVILLKKAKYPLVIAGNGAIRTPASEQLAMFVEKFNIPIVHTFMGQGAVPDTNAQSLFTLGFGFRDLTMDAVDQADVVITVGYDIAEYAPDMWNAKKNKKIIHIDFTPAEVYAHYQPEIEIVADVSATLKTLTDKLSEGGASFDDAWYVPLRQRIIKDIASYAPKASQSFTVPGVLHTLGEVMQHRDLLISDVGTHKIWVARNFSARCPNGCIISNGLASMGIALPGAIAASLYEPDRRIVAVMGDGGFMMNSQELETAKRMKTAFICIVFNDNDYGLISWKQQMSRGRSTGTKLTNPDFKAYTESFGIKAYRPTGNMQLKQQLARSLKLQELCVFEIPISTRVNAQLISKLKNMKRGR